MNEVREHAERLVRSSLRRSDLALDFEETLASSVEVHVEGRNFYPPMLRDIEAATSSVHVTQFGFRPGLVGDRFADSLVAKAGEGVPVRLVVDRQGSDPDRSSRAFYERLLAAGVRVRVIRATQLRASAQPVVTGAPRQWNVHQLGHIDHRKFVVVDGRVGWVGGAGIEDHFEDGRFHDLFLRLTGPVVSQFQLVFVASFAWLGGAMSIQELDSLFPEHEADVGAVPAGSCTTRRVGTGRSRLPYVTSSTGLARRLTS